MSTKATLRTTGAVLVFLALSTALSYHVLDHMVIDGHPELARWGLVDFREAVYYPARAFLDGANPYDPPVYMKTYPVGVNLPLYSPIILLLYLPFGLMKFEAAALAFLLLNLALTPVLAVLVLRLCGVRPTLARTFGLATLLLLSRGGYVNLFLGQCTVYVALAAYAAIYFGRTRPWLAGLALALVTLKPTVGGPLAILLLARREVRPVVIGVLVGAVGAGMPAAVLAYHAGGLTPFLGAFASTHALFETTPSINATSAPMRVDALALAGRLLGPPLGTTAEHAMSAGLLTLGALGIWRLTTRDDDNTRALSASLICLTIVTCIYQQVYGLLLLALPLTMFVTGRLLPATGQVRRSRWPIVALLGLPMFNFLMSRTALEALGTSLNVRNGWLLLLASLNSGAVFAAFVVCMGLALSAPLGAPTRRESARVRRLARLTD